MRNHMTPLLNLYFPLIKAFVILVGNSEKRRKMLEGFLSAKEAVEKYIVGCQAKVHTSDERLLGKAVLAGIMIGMGAAASSVAAHTITDVGLSRLAAAVVFPVGLMMVILLGAELFTGDCLMAMSVSAGKHSVRDTVRVLFAVYFGNLVGASLLAFLITMSGQLDYSSGMLGAYTIKVAAGKTGISLSKALTSGALCNILVCAAVLMATCAKDITGKLLSVFFTIMLFVTAGFEHCVANMYYITAGLLAKTNPDYVKLAVEQYGCTNEQIGALNVSNYLFGNLVPVTLGNILGGILFIGLPLYYLNREKVKVKNKNIAKERFENDVVYRRGIAGTGN